MSYDPNFYDVIKDGSLKSARIVVPFILENALIKNVLDVGCGEGWWLSVFKDHGCVVEGLDGDYVEKKRLMINPVEFDSIDLSHVRIPQFPESFDLVVCLEVAEHLPASRADTFVEDLTLNGDLILFSAAIPGQGGNGHVNEQWPDYWVERFKNYGFESTGILRWIFWDEPEVENWYRQNLILFARPEAKSRLSYEAKSWFNGVQSKVYPVVHPVLWEARR